MSGLDRELLAEKTTVIERHLAVVQERLPAGPEELDPMADASVIVIFHLWQAVQAAIDLAIAACVHFRLGAPQSYGEAFQLLAAAGFLQPELAARLSQATGFRNAVAHAYGKLDMGRVYLAAEKGPADLRAFLAALAERIQ
ncbi:MAG TPA: HepT-like ribonuclease domain-containing protein [Thermoanaerobaculia bacterium]|jgi:uncharacterized protein YutE (UPF0331/DUF86 family)